MTRRLRIIARILAVPFIGKPPLTPLGKPDWDGSYQRYLEACACPDCGRIDELTAISGAPCSGCWADEQDEREWCADYEDEEELA